MMLQHGSRQHLDSCIGHVQVARDGAGSYHMGSPQWISGEMVMKDIINTPVYSQWKSSEGCLDLSLIG